VAFWWPPDWTALAPGGSLPMKQARVTLACFCFCSRTWVFSACIKDASPQLRLTLLSTPWAGGRVIGKNGLAQGTGTIIQIGQETRHMNPIVRRSAVIASVFLIGLIGFSAKPSIAETPFLQLQSQKQESNTSAEAAGKAVDPSANSVSTNRTTETTKAFFPPSPYVATAYSLRGRTASGRMVSRGLIAADPTLLPLGSRVRLEHPGYSGEYLVADTGGAIRGRRIDIWTPSSREAMRFGRRTVKLTVLSYGPRRSGRSTKG